MALFSQPGVHVHVYVSGFEMTIENRFIIIINLSCRIWFIRQISVIINLG